MLIAFLLVAYFVPFLVASLRNHKDLAAIFVLNFFLGWTFIGWIFALVWAYTGNAVSPVKKIFISFSRLPSQQKSIGQINLIEAQSEDPERERKRQSALAVFFLVVLIIIVISSIGADEKESAEKSSSQNLSSSSHDLDPAQSKKETGLDKEFFPVDYCQPDDLIKIPEGKPYTKGCFYHMAGARIVHRSQDYEYIAQGYSRSGDPIIFGVHTAYPVTMNYPLNNFFAMYRGTRHYQSINGFGRDLPYFVVVGAKEFLGDRMFDLMTKSKNLPNYISQNGNVILNPRKLSMTKPMLWLEQQPEYKPLHDYCPEHPATPECDGFLEWANQFSKY